ncbi:MULTISPECIES: hypothetical protein [Streptacidiphilus]|uniref:Uncharacterized protein n=1 Tax=Streptacidiphilus cavernicola TaxID=3342716 RepID=A0ABV6UIE8_9ACTN|nr:hypothetical protein [Streptacidiphilus jeojiense]
MDSQTVIHTRRALHAVAETLLAGPQYRTSGTIRLQACPGGFATRSEPWLRVVGAELVAAGRSLPLQRTSCAGLAEQIGVAAGAPDGLYPDGSGVGSEEPFDVDPAAAEWLARCFAVGDAALRGTFPGSDPVIWPEHFDISVTVDAANYGVSPGDGFQSEPYAYVGPHEQRQGAFWNAPFGAARTLRELGGVGAVADFFGQGRRLLGGDA